MRLRFRQSERPEKVWKADTVSGFEDRVMPRQLSPIPPLRYYAPRDCHCVDIQGKRFYLPRDPAEAGTAYDRLISEWIANGRQLAGLRGEAPADLSVNELVVAFLKWADEYYRRPNGSPTKEPENLPVSVKRITQPGRTCSDGCRSVVAIGSDRRS